MKRIAKEITLKKDTVKDIEENRIDTSAFVERIKGYLEKANYLINNKMIDMSKEELYHSLSEVFDIFLEPYDYLKILSMKNDKHYSKFINVNTNMYDENNYNVSYLAVVTNKADLQDNDTLSLKDIRRLTDSYDLVLLKPKFEKKDNIDKKEKYESHLFEYINVNNSIISEDSDLFPYAAALLQKETIIKNVLYDLKLYVDEVKHQIRDITGLSLVKDNDLISKIGKMYKKAYEKSTNDFTIPKKEKVSVRYHQKVKKK